MPAIRSLASQFSAATLAASSVTLACTTAPLRKLLLFQLASKRFYRLANSIHIHCLCGQTI